MNRSGIATIIFDGDLSTFRRSKWIDNGYSLVGLGIGWPTGIVGTIAIELSNHGIDGVPGAVYDVNGSLAIDPTKQPNGTAGVLIINGITTSLAAICVTFTLGSGNDGAGKYFTDDSHIDGHPPTLSMKL